VVLLAPLLYPWHQACGVILPSIEEQWRRDGVFPIEQGATGLFVKVHVGFLDELTKYRTEEIKLSVPTLIIHGEHDQSVPIAQSVEFSKQKLEVTLVRVADNHQLLADPSALLAHISGFLGAVTEKVSTQGV
jgi:pimeloyl-ACP methyl ester carboxylesterase